MSGWPLRYSSQRVGWHRVCAVACVEGWLHKTTERMRAAGANVAISARR